MSEEQIIDLTEIDKKYKDKCSLIKVGKCKNVNIFIEQSRKLKAKEQECEKLKEKLEQQKGYTISYKEYSIEKQMKLEQQLDQLKAENGELKEERDTWLFQWKKRYEICESLSDDIDKLREQLDQLKEQLKAKEQENKKIIEKYRSVLEEIREDLETQIYCECSECGNDDYSECIKCMTKRYLQKISEVIKDEE